MIEVVVEKAKIEEAEKAKIEEAEKGKVNIISNALYLFSVIFCLFITILTAFVWHSKRDDSMA